MMFVLAVLHVKGGQAGVLTCEFLFYTRVLSSTFEYACVRYSRSFGA